jgi:hypothetical protein
MPCTWAVCWCHRVGYPTEPVQQFVLWNNNKKHINSAEENKCTFNESTLLHIFHSAELLKCKINNLSYLCTVHPVRATVLLIYYFRKKVYTYKSSNFLLASINYFSYTVLRPSHIPRKKVSLSTRAWTQSSCTVSVLAIAFLNPVIWWWIHLWSTAYDMRKRYTAGKYTSHESTSGSSDPYSAVPSHWSLIGWLD